MKKCPSCERTISPYASTCPNCGFDLTQGIVFEKAKIYSTPKAKVIVTRILNTKVLIIASLYMAVLLVCIYLSQPLHGNDKIAYDLILNNTYYFQKTHDIEILSGAVKTYNGSGEKYAIFTIAYTDSQGSRVEGHYEITKDGVTNIQEALDKANVPESYRGNNIDNLSKLNSQHARLVAALNISQFDSGLHYEKITNELNK